jgi:hypothetical protein
LPPSHPSTSTDKRHTSPLKEKYTKMGKETWPGEPVPQWRVNLLPPQYKHQKQATTSHLAKPTPLLWPDVSLNMRVEMTCPYFASKLSTSFSLKLSGKLAMYKFVGSCSCCCTTQTALNAYWHTSTKLVKNYNHNMLKFMYQYILFYFQLLHNV